MRNMRRTFSFLLCFMLIICALPASVSADINAMFPEEEICEATLVITNCDSVTGQNISGAEYEVVKMEDGHELGDPVTVDANESLDISDSGEYKIHEYKPANGYRAEVTEYVVTVERELAWYEETGSVKTRLVFRNEISGSAAAVSDSTCNIVYRSVPLSPAGTSIRSLKAGKNKMTVVWSRKNYSGYQIRYSRNRNMSGSKHVYVKNRSTTRRTVYRLKSGKKYYVQIRTYKNINGHSCYSAWSRRKCVTVK